MRAGIQDYQEHWHRYRRIRNMYFLLWLGYVPVTFVFGMVVSKVFGTYTPGFVFAGVWIATLVIVGSRLSAWRCPRCGKWFSATWWHNKGFLARKCVHCG